VDDTLLCLLSEGRNCVVGDTLLCADVSVKYSGGRYNVLVERGEKFIGGRYSVVC